MCKNIVHLLNFCYTCENKFCALITCVNRLLVVLTTKVMEKSSPDEENPPSGGRSSPDEENPPSGGRTAESVMTHSCMLKISTVCIIVRSTDVFK